MLVKRRAVGEIMGALILMFIASMAGVLLFTTTITASNEQGSTLRSQLATDSNSAQERFHVTYAELDKTSDKISIWVYNYGNVEINILEIYVNYSPIQSGIYELNIGEITEISFETYDMVTGPNRINILSEGGVNDVSEWIA